MAYLKSIDINGDKSDIREYKAGTGISIAQDGTISADASAPSWNSITGKPSFASVATSGSYNDLTNKPSIPDDTALKNRVSALESGKQDKLTAGSNITISGNTISAAGSSSVTVDSALSGTSTNPVQNKVIKGELDSVKSSVSGASASIANLDTRLKAIEDGGECTTYTLDGAYNDGKLTLTLSDGTDTQTKDIEGFGDFFAKEVSVSGAYDLTPLTSDAAPVYIDFKLTDAEGETWMIMGLGKYELRDSAGSRVYGVMVTAFSMNTQKTLRTYWKTTGTSNKTVVSGSAVIMCKRR